MALIKVSVYPSLPTALLMLGMVMVSLAWTSGVAAASQPEAEAGIGGSSDPFEPVNRASWKLNYDYLDKYALRPVVHGYVAWVPQPLRNGVGNFVRNFDEPSNTVNNLLVGRVLDSGRSVLRFALNSTVGLLGFIDVADGMGLDARPMSMDTVLGKATVNQGPYFMVPVYGPTTLRGAIGDTVDALYFPYAQMSFGMLAGHWALDGLDSRSRVVDQEAVLDNSLDPYLSAKDFYLQYQEGLVHDGQPAPQKQAEDEELNKYMDEID